jgi:hypothetical protein
MPQRSSLGRAILQIVIAALWVAALVACIALLRGDINDTDWKVIGTSTLFALASSFAAAGLGVRDRVPTLATVTLSAAALAFLSVSAGMWLEADGEGFWRATACICIVALETAHVSFVLARRRATDPPSVDGMAVGVVGLATLSGAMGLAPTSGLLSTEGNFVFYGELLGVVLVGQLLCTALAPLLRRLDAGAERPVIDVTPAEPSLAHELVAVAERLEQLGAGPQVRVECERLRRLARSAASG